MEAQGRRIVVAASILAAVGIGVLIAASLADGPDPLPDMGSASGDAEGSLRAPADPSPRSLRSSAETVQDGGAATSRRAAMDTALQTEVRGSVQAYGELHGKEKAAKEAGSAERAQWERRWHKETGRLRRRLRNPAAALALLRMAPELGLPEAVTLRVGRLLQGAEGEAIEDALRQAAIGSEHERVRLLAVAGLENRDAGVWLEPVTAAYRKDASTEVRDEAAAVLGRSLADPKHIRSQRTIRATILSELENEDPAARARALEAMVADRSAGPAELERVRAHLNDPDATVRQMAKMTERVIEQRLARRGR